MQQIAVLVVDDSVVVRRLVTTVLAEAPDIEVVGTASNGRLALGKIEQLNPDVVTLDIEMPEMDGITTVREIRKVRPRLPVIMFSTLTSAGASATLDALASGASDYVTKPANVGSFSQSLQSIREQLIPRIRALAGAPARPAGAPGTARPAPGAGTAAGHPPATAPGPRAAPAAGRDAAAPRAAPATGPVEVLAIGCSTGGPAALTKVLTGLPAALPVPVVVVQHMPPVFTKMFAERLDRLGELHVVEAADRMPLTAGTVYIAPGDHHLEVVRSGTATVTKLHDGPQENFCRPAVDVLFRSVAARYGRSVLAVVLTGMGSDGRRGSAALRAAGASVFAQDQATSVVWGMPGAVAEAGLAEAVLPLDGIAPAVLKRLAAGHAPVAMRGAAHPAVPGPARRRES
jgi:two-component system chemotaxis response regulator CheB